MKLSTLLFAGCCVIAGQVQAALFSDDEAHNQIRLIRERVTDLEIARKQQEDAFKQQEDALKQQNSVIKKQEAALKQQEEALRQQDLIIKKQDSELKQLDAARKNQNEFAQGLQNQLGVQKSDLSRLFAKQETLDQHLKEVEKLQTGHRAMLEKELQSLRSQSEDLKRNLQETEKRIGDTHKEQYNSILLAHDRIQKNLEEQAKQKLSELQDTSDQQKKLLAGMVAQQEEKFSQLELRVANFQNTVDQQSELHKELSKDLYKRQEDLNAGFVQLKEDFENQTQSTLGLQGQIDSQNAEFKKIQGYGEDLENRLKESSQRLSNIYADLDARIRNFDIEFKKQIESVHKEVQQQVGQSEQTALNKLLEMDKHNAELIQQQNQSILSLQSALENQDKELRSQSSALLHNLQELEKQQKELSGEMNKQLQRLNTVFVADLKKQMDTQSGEAGMLREQNVEFVQKLQDVEKRQAEVGKQQSGLTNKLQSQIAALNAELNKLRAQNEELVRNLNESKQGQASIGNQQAAALDMQAKLDAEQNAELRKLHSQNEDLIRSLQEIEKRQKGFYGDMDTTLRQFEAILTGASSGKASAPAVVQPAKPNAGVNGATGNPAAADSRAYDLASGKIKAGNYQHAVLDFQEFLKKYPDSAYAANAHYQLGYAYHNLKDYKNALDSYQLLVNKYASNEYVPDAMLGIADCQQQLKAVLGARKTLNQIIEKYPGSKFADLAKKRLDNMK